MYTIYSKDNCPQCRQALQMIRTKQLPVTVLKLGEDYTRDELLAMAPGARSVPQVFFDDMHIGGVPELRDHLLDL